MKSKLNSLIMVLAVAFVLAGCSKSETPAPPAPPAPPATNAPAKPAP